MSHVPTDSELDRDLAFAIEIARHAGRRCLSLRNAGRWPDEKILGDVADQAADGLLQGYLRGRHPEDGILSEETKDGPERLERARTWIVDPLDGTKEFRSGRVDWAVHVALCVDGEPVIGAVDLPSLGACLWGVCVEGRQRGGCEGSDAKLHGGASDRPSRPRIVCSRSHTPEWMERFAAELDADLVRCGSVGYKVSRMLLGEADVYVHKNGLKEWDTCAPEAVARALGWHVSKLDGTAHRYNLADPRHGELLACRPSDVERVVAAARASGLL